MPRQTRSWDDDEPRLRALVAQGRTAAECARELGRPIASVQSKITRLGVGPIAQARAAVAPLRLAGATIERSVRHEGPVEVVAPLETAEESDDAFLARVVRRTARQVATARAQHVATVRIAADRPIGLSLTSDWHAEADGAVDVAGLLAHADAVRTTPGLYTAAIGDLGNNAIKHRGGAGPQSIPDELRLLDILLGRYGSKMLWMTSGNHDDWTVQFSGVDNLRALARRHRIHYAPDELVVLVEIVNPADPEEVTARWVVATRHQYYRNSNLNYTHACWRWLESNSDGWPRDEDNRTLLPDVLAIGHNHLAAAEVRTTKRGPVAALRMGPWQIQSSYARAKGFGEGVPSAPTVILPPTRGAGLHAYADYRHAVEHLTTGRPVATDAAA